MAKEGMTKENLARKSLAKANLEKVRVTKFDAADYLKTPDAVAAYLTEAFESGDRAYILTALDTVARAKGIAAISKKTGLTRASLYKAFAGKSQPEFDTVRKVMTSVGVKLVVEPIGRKKAE